MKHAITAVLAVGLMLALAGAAQAAVTETAYWSFGDNDAGATLGATVNAVTKDSLAGADGTYDIAKLQDTPTYVDTTTLAGGTYGKGIQFNGGNWSAAMLGAISSGNMGLQMKIYLPSAMDGRLGSFYGSVSLDASDTFSVYYNNGDFGYFRNVPYAMGEWHDLAIITNGGEADVYVDGIYNQQGWFANWGATMNWGDKGDFAVGEARMFTYDGAFDSADLSADWVKSAGPGPDMPEPATMSLLLIGGAAALIRRRKA